MVQTAKNLPSMQEFQVRSLGQEDSLEKGMATHSSILVWWVSGQRSLVGHSPWGHKELDVMGATEHTHIGVIYLLKTSIWEKIILRN